jgi:CBS domain-containing protein
VDVSDLLATPVRRVMRDAITALTPETSLAAAAKLFAERRVGGAPVVDAGGRVLGVASRSDLLRGAAGGDRRGTSAFYLMLHGEPVISGTHPPGDPSGAPDGVVGDVMNKRVISVAPDSPLRDAVATMLREEIHRLLVLDGDKLVGVVSTMDVLRAMVPDEGPKSTSGY